MCFFVEFRGREVHLTCFVLTELCANLFWFYACLYLTDEPCYSVLLAVYILRAGGDTGCFAAQLQKKVLLILMISLFLMKAQQRSLLTSIMSAAFCSFPKAAWMPSEDFRLFLVLFLYFLGDALLPGCFPTSFNSCEQLKILNLQKLLVPNNMH